MKKRKKNISREVGLEIASICGRYFLKLEDLHYGYWTPDLPVDIGNLNKAQQNYTELLISNLPDGVHTILDVGFGTGAVARRLIERGHKVDAVSPSSFFAEQGRQLLGDQVNIFECRYEDVQTEKRYDLVLFSESFQYIHLETALEKTWRLLNDGGYMLICDVFRKETEGRRHQKGGHRLGKFRELMKDYPFEPLRDIDITELTAPTIDILADALNKVGEPVLRSGLRFFSERYPIAFKLFTWKYRKQLTKASQKYFNGERTGENFRKFKSYRLMLFRKALAQQTTAAESLHRAPSNSAP
ncbi:MAG TPA: class I SAM-dependent methyltransferase [Sedimentisphaerales bacterium]|nr:class I SAM-dependent methyltransferase [Sedimentisphaerales bacterium]